MFAYAYYVMDKQLAKVPVGYIKKFEMDTYNAESVYKVFWSRFIHSIQNENDNASMASLRSLREPPSKVSWNIAEGEGYYSAFILRVEDSLDVLIESLRKKRPTMPASTQNEDGFLSSTTEDEVAVLQLQKGNKKEEEAERKKQEQAAKRIRAEDIFKAAKRSRKGTFSKKVCENDSDSNNDLQMSDSEEDPEVIPRTMYTQLKASYDFLEKEKEKVDNKLESLEKKFCEFKKQYEEMKIECNEVTHLRSLNRQLQGRLLDLPITQGGCFHAAGRHEENQTASDSETLEVELGAGISIDRTVYKQIYDLDHVRKFTKSLAVCIWGTTTLAGRSVKGKPCRNRNGPKKIVPGAVQTPVHHSQQESKPPLTPEKLAVISGQMREYLLNRGRDMAEVEAEVKNRNRYISDKIQDICSNVARAEARIKYKHYL